MAIDWNQVIFKGLEIKGIYGREMFETWYKMVAMLQSGLDLSPMITHRYAVDDYEKAFATMLSGQSGKVVLDWAESRLPDRRCSRLMLRCGKLGGSMNAVADRLPDAADARRRAARGCARSPTTTRRSPIARS